MTFSYKDLLSSHLPMASERLEPCSVALPLIMCCTSRGVVTLRWLSTGFRELWQLLHPRAATPCCHSGDIHLHKRPTPQNHSLFYIRFIDFILSIIFFYLFKKSVWFQMGPNKRTRPVHWSAGGFGQARADTLCCRWAPFLKAPCKPVGFLKCDLLTCPTTYR